MFSLRTQRFQIAAMESGNGKCVDLLSCKETTMITIISVITNCQTSGARWFK
jgi:hypothetical protein